MSPSPFVVRAISPLLFFVIAIDPVSELFVIAIPLADVVADTETSIPPTDYKYRMPDSAATLRLPVPVVLTSKF